MSRNFLWEAIQSHMDDPSLPYSPKPADISRKTGISAQVLSKWKSAPTLPDPEQLARLAKGTGLSYLTLLAASLKGKGYLPADAELSATVMRTVVNDPDGLRAFLDDAIARLSDPEEGLVAARRGTSRGQALRQAQDEAGEGSQDDGGMDPA